MTLFVLDWAQAAEAGPARAGGKGWQLGRLARLGVPVPAGFIIEAAASARHSPGALLPANLIMQLAQELERRGWSRQPLAVRSSAPMEDSARASFAGIHRSCLNTQGLDATVQAVRDVWDSLWTPQALAYRQHLEIPDSEAAMAVVVMPLLPAVASGIVFTCDPLSGRDDQLLIHAHWGLGEALVGGQADGDEYRLQENRLDDSLFLIEQRLGSKARLTVPAPAGGTELRSTPAGQAARQVLTPAQTLVLGELARDTANALDYTNTGYDVEWVWDGERFWIVQARPVTARGRYTYPALAKQPTYWSRGNTREILPEPLSPMDWGLCRTMVNRMLTRGYELSGYITLPGVQRAGLLHGRLYLQTSLMQWEGYDALGIAPKAMNQLLGGIQPEIALPPPTLGQRWAKGLRTLRYLRRSARQRRNAEATLAQARQRAAAWLAQEIPADNTGLMRELRLQLTALRRADDLFFLQGSGGGTLFNLVQLVEKYCPGDGHALTAALMAGGEPSPTAAQGYDLLALARIAASDTQALAWLRRPGRTSAGWQDELAGNSPFRHAFADFLQHYGHRGVYETYLRNPRWREAPGYLLDSVVNLIGCDPAPLRKRQEQAAGDAWQRLRQVLPFWLPPIVEKLVKDSRADCNHREAARSAIIAHLEVLRRGIFALGLRLAGPGGLERPEDIFNLKETEMFALAEGKLPPAAAARRAAERRRQLEILSTETEPEVVIEHGDAAPAPTTRSASMRDARGELWRGTAVGSGCAHGSVRIARSPADGLAMAAGEVLVTASTDPAWTPLFLKAGALIMETGGYLSHGAIVAREFGIPAVVGLPGIFNQLHNGEQVEVDGNQGVVRRLQQIPSAGNDPEEHGAETTLP